MKLKAIHWVLIAVLLIEAVVLGIWFGTKDNQEPPSDVKPTELLLTYDANEDGSYNLLSLLAAVEEPDIAFTFNDVEYKYDASLVELVDAYRSLGNYKKLQEDATEELWAEFQNQVMIATRKNTNKQHASIQYIRNIATNYGIPHEHMYDNNGMYTINTTTTINNWEAIFADYIIKDENGAAVNELAMGATVRIGETDYNALVYTVVNPDGDANNNSTAQEVSVHILFGVDILQDIATSDATIYYLKPDGSEYFAHSDIKVTYMATSNEARYRDLLSLGGLQ